MQILEKLSVKRSLTSLFSLYPLSLVFLPCEQSSAATRRGIPALASRAKPPSPARPRPAAPAPALFHHRGHVDSMRAHLQPAARVVVGHPGLAAPSPRALPCRTPPLPHLHCISSSTSPHHSSSLPRQTSPSQRPERRRRAMAAAPT